MNENQIKPAEPYVHPIRASFSLENWFLAGFLLSSIGAVISLVLVSWKRMEYMHAIETFGEGSESVMPFLVSYDLTKPFAVLFCLLTVACFGLGLYFRFRKKK